MNKRAVRRLMIKRLKGKSTGSNQTLYERLFSLRTWQRARVISVTISTPLELSTRPIIKRAWSEHKRVVVPKVKPHRQMIFVPYRSDTPMGHDSFGILEPVSDRAVQPDLIDLVIVPGLAFAKSGERLGFGGGYYDRFLKRYQGATVALANHQQLFDRPVWPVGKWDVKVDRIISNEGSCP